MTTPTYTPTDVVNFAVKKDAVNLGSAFNDLIGQRVYDAVQARKVEIAKSMFQPPVEATAEDEEEQQEVEASAEESDDGEDGEEQQQDQSEEPDEKAEQST